jgi:hypothetical protein
MELAVSVNTVFISFQGEQKNRHGRFLKLERFPDHPANRIYFSTLSQCPRGKVFYTRFSSE